jgi:hypothetical protein
MAPPRIGARSAVPVSLAVEQWDGADIKSSGDPEDRSVSSGDLVTVLSARKEEAVGK